MWMRGKRRRGGHPCPCCGQSNITRAYEEREIRKQIAEEIETLLDGVEPKNEHIARYAPVDAKEIIWRSARIARGEL